MLENERVKEKRTSVWEWRSKNAEKDTECLKLINQRKYKEVY